MADIDGSKRSEISSESWFGDIDPENSVKIIQDIFKGKLDADVVSMVFSECEFNVDQAIETLFALVDDTNNEATGMDNKSGGAYDEIYASNYSTADEDVNSNRDQSLYDWPTLQSACNFRPRNGKHKQQSAKNTIAIVQPLSVQSCAVSSNHLEMSPTKTTVITKSTQEEYIQTISDTDSSCGSCHGQNELSEQSLNKTIINICKTYESSKQQSSIEHYQGISDTLIKDLPTFNLGTCFLSENNQHTFIVPKITTSTEIASTVPVITLPNSEALRQTPSFIKCLNQGSFAKEGNTLNNLITNGLLPYHSLHEEENQFGANNSKMSPRETVSTYMRIDKKLLVILRGLPGSGKSTLAWQLYSEFSGSVFSTDDFFVRDGKYNMKFALLSEAHEWNRKRAATAMANGEFLVIIDNTNIEAWEIKPYVALGLKYGYFIEILEPETSWKFNLNQLAKRNIHGVPKAKITRMLEHYDHNVFLGDIIDEINSENSNNSAISINQRNFSTTDISITSGSDISKLYLGEQENIHNQVMDDFNKKSCLDSTANGMPASFYKEESHNIINENYSIEANGNDNSANHLPVEDRGTASAMCSILDFDKNDRIEVEGEKNLCLDELIGLLYESEESLSRHTSLSCSSQDVSAWEAITELDDEFLWTAEILPAASTSLVNKNELNEIDEKDAIIEDDVKLLVENISEINTLKFNAVSHEISNSKTVINEEAINEICTKTQNRTDNETVSEICFNSAIADENIIGEVYVEEIDSVDNKTVNEICDKALKNINEETASEKKYQEFNEKIYQELSWEESTCTINKTEDGISSPRCIQHLNELNDSYENSDSLNNSPKDFGNIKSGLNDDIVENRNTLTSRNQITCLSDIDDPKLQLKENIIAWEESIVDNSDWDSDKSDNNKSVCKTEPKPQRKCKRQKKGKFRRDNTIKSNEVSYSDDTTDLHNQESAINFPNSPDDRNLQVIRNSSISEQSKSYWTRSNKKSKVAARLTCGSADKHSMNSDEQKNCTYIGNDKITKEHSCLRCSTTKKDCATQICFKDFILLQNANFSNFRDDKNDKKNNAENELSLQIVCDDTHKDSENDDDTSLVHNVNITNNDLPKEEERLTLLDSLQHYFPFVVEQDLQDALEYSHYDLGEAICVLIKYGYSIINKTKKFMSSDAESVLNLSHKETDRKQNLKKNVSDDLIPHVILNTTEMLKESEASCNKDNPISTGGLECSNTIDGINYQNITNSLNCPSTSDGLNEKMPTLPNPFRLELRLDPALALQLQELFGPVGFHLSPDSFSSNDRTLVINMELAKMLHQCWSESLKSRFENEEMIMNEISIDETNSATSNQDNMHLVEIKENNINQLSEISHNSFYCEEICNPVGSLPPLVVTNNNVENQVCKDKINQQNCMTTKSLEVLPLKEIMDMELAIQLSQEDMVKRAKQDKKFKKDQDMAIKLSLQKLYDTFPAVDREALYDVFVSNNYSYSSTVGFLENALECEINTRRSTHLQSSKWNITNTAEQMHKNQTQEANKTEVGYHQDTYCAEDADYDYFCLEATKYYSLRKEYCEKAKNAYYNGMKAVASFYSQQCHLFTRKFEQANQMAAKIILEAKNSRKESNILDLHGLHVKEALDALKVFLQMKKNELEYSVIRKQAVFIITGKGNHSPNGIAKIKPTVLDYLRLGSYEFEEIDGGFFKVMLFRGEAS